MIRIREADRRYRLWFLGQAALLGRHIRRRGASLASWAEEEIHAMVTEREARR